MSRAYAKAEMQMIAATPFLLLALAGLAPLVFDGGCNSHQSRFYATRSALKSVCVKLETLLRDCSADQAGFALQELTDSKRHCAQGPYARPSELLDGWSRRYELELSGTVFRIRSLGRDGQRYSDDDLQIYCPIRQR